MHSMRMRVRIRKISKSKDRQGGYPYIRIRVLTHDIQIAAYDFSVFEYHGDANAYMDS